MRIALHFLSVSPVRWPLWVHCCVGAALLGGLSAWGVVSQSQLMDMRRARSVTAAQLREKTAIESGIAGARVPLAAIPTNDALARDIEAAALHRSVRVVSLDYTRGSRIGVSARGEYGAVREWLAELQQLQPGLRLAQFSTRAPTRDEAPESTVALLLSSVPVGDARLPSVAQRTSDPFGTLPRAVPTPLPSGTPPIPAVAASAEALAPAPIAPPAPPVPARQAGSVRYADRFLAVLLTAEGGAASNSYRIAPAEGVSGASLAAPAPGFEIR